MLTSEQLQALDAIGCFLQSSDRIYRLAGYAGTGKTHLISLLAERLGPSAVLTATTNKATKVLRRLLKGTKAKTIYSLLGIRMVARDENMELEFPKNPTDLSRFSVVFVDEGSTIPSELYDYLLSITKFSRTKFVLVGDRAQLPPVGETESPIWKLDCPSSELTTVVRHDNHILKCATAIREVLRSGDDQMGPLLTGHSASEGVWTFASGKWVEAIRKAASRGLFTEVDNTKIVAWRNRTVDELNALVRTELHGSGCGNWLPGDRIMIREPVLIGPVVVANIDDEGTVTQSLVSHLPNHPDLITYRLTVTMDETGLPLTVEVIHPDSSGTFRRRLDKLAVDARSSKNWKSFWGLRNSVHSIRYSYALTAHRSQGSTYKNVFVDAADIRANPNKAESLKCLYVAVTRPSDKLLVLP